MKLNKPSQLLLVSAASLLIAGYMTACISLTVDFVFVASSKAAGPENYGEVDVFEINSESGRMRQIPTSPFPSGGRNPVAEAVSSDMTNLYVVNQDDNSIVQFVVGNDGKLYPASTTNTPGIYPLGVTVSGKTLFVLDTYQPLPTCSTASPCSGSIAAFPIIPSSSTPPSDALGTPVANGGLNYWPLNLPSAPEDIILPTGVTVLASGADLYVSAYDSTAKKGYIFGFAVASSGALTPLNGGVPFAAGTQPSAIASDHSSGYVYVTDFINGNVLGYSVGSTGLLTAMSSSPFPAGNEPSAIVVDPTYNFAYVANSLDSTVEAYSLSNGVLTRLGTYATGLQPVAIGIDPSTSHFLYTANYIGSTVSGFELSSTAGTLLDSQFSPYDSNGLPTAVAAIPHNGVGSVVK